MGEALQYVSVLAAIPLEENLILAEDATHAVHRDIAVFQNVQVVVPKLILDEEGHFGAYDAQKSTRIGDGVEGKIADDVGTFIVLAYLIA